MQVFILKISFMLSLIIFASLAVVIVSKREVILKGNDERNHGKWRRSITNL